MPEASLKISAASADRADVGSSWDPRGHLPMNPQPLKPPLLLGSEESRAAHGPCARRLSGSPRAPFPVNVKGKNHLFHTGHLCGAAPRFRGFGVWSELRGPPFLILPSVPDPQENVSSVPDARLCLRK